MALHVNGGPYDPGPTQQSCGPQLSITHYPSGRLRIYWAGCLRISLAAPRRGRWAGNHLFFLHSPALHPSDLVRPLGPATTASRGHRMFPGLIGKKPAFPRIRTAYRTEAKRKRYHCTIEHSCERRLIFFICLISEWFPYGLPLRHRTLQTQIESCGAGMSSRAHSGGVHGARRQIRGVVPGEWRRDHGSAAGARRGERGSVPAAASLVDGGGKVTSLTKYLKFFLFSLCC